MSAVADILNGCSDLALCLQSSGSSRNEPASVWILQGISQQADWMLRCHVLSLGSTVRPFQVNQDATKWSTTRQTSFSISGV
jgi:hypothetical protein